MNTITKAIYCLANVRSSLYYQDMSKPPSTSDISASRSIERCSRPVQFWRAGRIESIPRPSPNQTLLEYLRSDEGAHACGTKEGCAEGDCGACTVVIAELQGKHQSLRFRAINSCIRFAYQIDGCALWTVEDLSAPHFTGVQSQEALHPVQEALLAAHGSQCGFCTPGFVMSLFALYQSTSGQIVDRQQAIEALSGNLCRCTGYRPILEAAQAMIKLARVEQPDEDIKSALTGLSENKAVAGDSESQKIFRPADLKSLLQHRHDRPQAQLIAGATDVGLWVTKQGRRFEQVIDITAAHDLQHINTGVTELEIGAAVRLQDAFKAIVRNRPQIAVFAHRFAGLPVRQSGTLGGNIANGSPIGDSMPLLISLGARVRLASLARGSREVALEDFYLAYRQTQLSCDEVLTHVLIPLPTRDELSRIYKVSKRFEDDISALCLGIRLTLSGDGTSIASARIGVGGMSATPTRAYKTETLLIGKPFALESFRAARTSIGTEFTPLDDMRASAHYRREVAGNLILRFWQDLTQPEQLNSLEGFNAQPISVSSPSNTDRKGD
jgi:xanthine dehydrogenase small subunit